ncbi:MAG: response regulator, partial [Gemella haemolysans]|nr:response regulator [Gemella haemolysans]
MRVLIIEDDPMVAMIHKEYFKKKELTDDLSHVTSIEAAREYLENNDVDLIVLDNYLIDGQGIEYLPELKGYPIIMITAANDVQTVEAALSNGVVDYLVKPFTYERFSQAIDKVQDYVKLLSKEKINQDLIDDYLNSGRV